VAWEPWPAGRYSFSTCIDDDQWQAVFSHYNLKLMFPAENERLLC
jgi:hypothetical protein